MTRIPFKPSMPPALPALAATVVLALSGCTTDQQGDGGPTTAGPTATYTGAPGAAGALAERYHRSGGAEEVYGMQYRSASDGTLAITVWTHNPDDSAQTFDGLKSRVTAFLAREEGVSLTRGYQMDVFGPTGALQHRLDARP
ncbi:hypothetical protein CG740_20580 [Streptomyces sp. CB01201]|uniref:hypothetical protein n=1 Tax=unclassified Streptomyces TaxID=2593676 RepID=UPI000C27A05D|nr:hypothetical protein [Streptomyces sp. CB01201]PJN01084.1 hypothetical protein CG740_20580 [Streptomyces sp. CB01201]